MKRRNFLQKLAGAAGFIAAAPILSKLIPKAPLVDEQIPNLGFPLSTRKIMEMLEEDMRITTAEYLRKYNLDCFQNGSGYVEKDTFQIASSHKA